MSFQKIIQTVAIICITISVGLRFAHVYFSDIAYVFAISFLSFIALPVYFHRLYVDKKTGMEIVLLYSALVLVLLFSTFKILHLAIDTSVAQCSIGLVVLYFVALVYKAIRRSHSQIQS